MKLLKIIRTDKFVRYAVEIPGEDIKSNNPDDSAKPNVRKGTESMDVTCHEAPLPAFDNALASLADVACNILEVGQSYKKGMSVHALSLSYTKSGVRSAQIFFKKQLDGFESDHAMSTPVFQIDDDKTGKGRKQCAKKHAEAVIEMIKQASRYVDGKRSQTLLDFKEEKPDEDDDNTEQLPLDESDK